MSDTPEDLPQPYRLHASLGYHLSLAARRQERRLEDRLKLVGLNRTTWCILLAIGNEDLTQPSDIATFVGIDRTATSRALRGMETDGLVARASGREDRRTRRITLTDKGRRVMVKATPAARENGQLMADLMSAEDHAELLRLLNIIIDGTPADLPSI